MSIFNRILFAGDFSKASRGAFVAAGALARESGAQLHALHVVEPVLLSGPPGHPGGGRLPGVLPADTPVHRRELREQLRAFYQARPSLAVDYFVRDGHAADEILRAADEVDADLIAMGTHGRSGVDHLLCGSVAESVLRRTHRPVLFVRGPAAVPGDAPIRRILHPSDFSGCSRPALDVARSLARASQAELVLLHVAPAEVLAGGTFCAPEDLQPEREELATLQRRCAEDGLDGSVRARFGRGDPAAEIVRSAEELGCDLIVMGSHGRTGLGRLVLGSVAEAVIRKAPCLVLVVKDGQRQARAIEEAKATASAP